MNIINNTLETIRKKGDVFTETLNYFIIKDGKFARFYTMCQAGQLFLIVDILLSLHLHLWTSIYNLLLRKLNHMSKTTMIS